MITLPILVELTLDVSQTDFELSIDDNEIELTNEYTINVSLYPDYAGTVEVTPSTEQVVLATAGTVVRQDIVVNPVPSNYGLITYNGAYLTVS